jgi:hypothetical protein
MVARKAYQRNELARKMIELNGTQWVLYQGALLPDTAPHKEIALSDQEQKYLLRHSKAYFLRWTSHWDSPHVTEFWHVIKDQPTSLDDYPVHTRRDIRRGLRKCSVRKVSAKVLAESGYEVYHRAFLRYKTHLRPVTESTFKKSLERPKPNADYWAVFEAEKLVAYAINYLIDEMCTYAVIKLDPEKLNTSCSYALVHTMNEYYLDNQKLRYLTDGERSISHATRFQEFLIEKFLFRKAYCQLHVVYAPRLVLPVRLLFPLRGIVSRLRQNWFCKLAVLLKHEEIRRSFG